LYVELTAYSTVLTAFRAQGELTWRKEKILQELRDVLRIPEERHRLELARVLSEAALTDGNLFVILVVRKPLPFFLTMPW
jgi:hypothetical protein